MLQKFLPFLALTGSTTAACTREFLREATARYVSAQISGNPSLISPLTTANTTYLENFLPANISSGILRVPLKVDNRRSTHDPQNCSSFTELIAASNPHPYVLGTQLWFSPDNATNNSLTRIDTLVTDEGDWLFNATGYMYWNNQESWPIIPPEKRDSRAVIQAAADAYFNRFSNANVSVPFGTPCARLEGGAYTGSRNQSMNSCSLGLPSTIKIGERRYVVDEEMGTADLYVLFPGLDRSSNKSAPDSHFFRVEGGQIKYIHTLSTCENKGCGVNGTFVPGRRRWQGGRM